MMKAFKYSILAAFLLLCALGNAQIDSTNQVIPESNQDKLNQQKQEHAQFEQNEQLPDTLAKKPKTKNPKTAALLSAVLPGAGQVYNRKFWKLPIVYAGIGTATYFIITNRSEYIRYREAYVLDNDTTNGLISEFNPGDLTQSELEQLLRLERQYADQYRTWMEYSFIGFFAVYALQIVDATVDAHLFSFDVTDDLTLNALPTFQYTATRIPVTGLRLSLNF